MILISLEMEIDIYSVFKWYLINMYKIFTECMRCLCWRKIGIDVVCRRYLNIIQNMIQTSEDVVNDKILKTYKLSRHLLRI